MATARVGQQELEFYPALAIAVFIAAGYMADFPLEWTRNGTRAKRRHMYAPRCYDGMAVIREAWHKTANQFRIRERAHDDLSPPAGPQSHALVRDPLEKIDVGASPHVARSSLPLGMAIW